jgi:hypothetical protein
MVALSVGRVMCRVRVAHASKTGSCGIVIPNFNTILTGRPTKKAASNPANMALSHHDDVVSSLNGIE